jgi:hypothetical protein
MVVQECLYGAGHAFHPNCVHIPPPPLSHQPGEGNLLILLVQFYGIHRAIFTSDPSPQLNGCTQVLYLH